MGPFHRRCRRCCGFAARGRPERPACGPGCRATAAGQLLQLLCQRVVFAACVSCVCCSCAGPPAGAAFQYAASQASAARPQRSQLQQAPQQFLLAPEVGHRGVGLVLQAALPARAALVRPAEPLLDRMQLFVARSCIVLAASPASLSTTRAAITHHGAASDTLWPKDTAEPAAAVAAMTARSLRAPG